MQNIAYGKYQRVGVRPHIYMYAMSLAASMYTYMHYTLCFSIETRNSSTQRQRLTKQPSLKPRNTPRSEYMRREGDSECPPTHTQVRDNNMQDCGSVTTMHSSVLNFHTLHVVYKGIGMDG